MFKLNIKVMYIYISLSNRGKVDIISQLTTPVTNSSQTLI